MSDQRLASPKVLQGYCPENCVPLLAGIGATTGRGTATNWPVANRAIFVPVPCPGPFTIRRLAWENGTTVSGNVDMGVYTSQGQLVVSTGSTAQATGNVWQTVDVTDTDIPPGWYYLALVLNNTTGTNQAASSTTLNMRQLGCQMMDSAFPLPATATFAVVGNSYMPSFQAMGVDTI